MSESSGTADAARLALDDYGRDDGRTPIVLVHGLSFSRRTWQPVVEAIRAADPDRRLIALDLPGHGDSPAQPPHDLQPVAAVVHSALDEVRVRPPLMVGHSLAGALVSLYGSVFPVAGIFNVDQPMDIRPFAQLMSQLGPALRGPDFERIWREVFFASFHVELLPEPGATLARETCVPRQDIVLSYWRQVIEEPADDVMAMIAGAVERLRAKDVPYTILFGHEPAPGEVDGMRAVAPSVQVVTWPNSSHLPHLAAPERFAELVLSAAGAVDPEV